MSCCVKLVSGSLVLLCLQSLNIELNASTCQANCIVQRMLRGRKIKMKEEVVIKVSSLRHLCTLMILGLLCESAQCVLWVV